MFSQFLLPETTVREAGVSPDLHLGSFSGSHLTVTLGISRIIEQESIDVSIWGSADGADWGTKPLASFSQKFYCGTYQMVLDLSGRPEVKRLRAKWHVNRWGKGDPKPLFTVYVFVQEMKSRTLSAGA